LAEAHGPVDVVRVAEGGEKISAGIELADVVGEPVADVEVVRGVDQNSEGAVDVVADRSDECSGGVKLRYGVVQRAA
jgi:hypothetical protein